MITSKNLIWSIAAAALLVATSASTSAQSVVFDDFVNDPPGAQIVEFGGTGTQMSSLPADVLGGVREIEFTVTKASGGLPARALAEGGFFEMSFPEFAEGYSIVRYDGGNDPGLQPDGLGGINFTKDSQSQFTIEIPFSDLETYLELSVYTNDTSASEATVHIGGDAAPFTAVVPFSSFTAKTGLAPANFSDVGAFEVKLNGEIPDGSLDILIGSIGTISVPEPASLATFLTGVFGLLGFGWHGMRRRQRVRISA